MYQSVSAIASLVALTAVGTVTPLALTTPSLMEIASDARTVTFEPPLQPTRIVRCVSGRTDGNAEIIDMATKSFISTPIPWPACSTPNAKSAKPSTTLALIVEAAETPIIWHCQRTAPMSDKFSSCIKLGTLSANSSSFDQLVLSLPNTPLILAAPADMTYISRDG